MLLDGLSMEAVGLDILNNLGKTFLEGIKSVDVELTFNPPWTPDLLSDDIKLELGMM